MTNTPHRTTPLFLSFRDAWSAREDEILAGTRMTSIGDRRRGHSAFKGDPDADARALAQSDIDADIHTHATVMLLRAAILYPAGENFYAVYRSMGAAGDEVDSYLWHAAIRGYPAAVSAWTGDLTTARDRDRIGHLQGMAVAMGMMSSLQAFDGNNQSADNVAELRNHGLGILRKCSETLVEWDAATEEIEDPQPDPAAKRKLDAAIETMKADEQFLHMMEDRAEIRTAPASPEGPGLVVLEASAALSRSDSKIREGVLASVRPIIGKRMPLVGGYMLQEARAALVRDMPHCTEIIDRVLNRQVGKPYFNARVIFYGDKGCGKSTLVDGICRGFGLPAKYVNVARQADTSLFGTPSQYGTAQASGVLLHVVDSKIGNPVMKLDEIEKAGSGDQNGNFLSGLLGFTEPSTAAVMDDPGLGVSVDLSAVNYLCTANSLEGLPEPLRDRFMIVRVPNPTWQHIGGLSRKILADLAEKQGDARWARQLDPDEIEIVKKFWPGGSIRALREVLEAFVANREQSMGMH